MKKDTSSNAQEAGDTEGQGRNIPSPGKKAKANNSQTMDDMRDNAERHDVDKNSEKGRDHDVQGDSGRS